jgi:hypothetical protein
MNEWEADRLYAIGEGRARNCGACVFAHFPQDNIDVVQCRRHAPRPDAAGDFQWPSMDADTDWCGEFISMGQVERFKP